MPVECNVRREYKMRGRARIIVTNLATIVNHILLLENGKRENLDGCLRDTAAYSNVRQITSIFYCNKTDSYHLPRRHVWTIRQSVNWYKDMYNRAIWKPLYCPILIPMTFIRLSSYRSRRRSILLVWRQNTLLNIFFPFSYSALGLLSNFRTYNNELAIHIKRS